MVLRLVDDHMAIRRHPVEQVTDFVDKHGIGTRPFAWDRVRQQRLLVGVEQTGAGSVQHFPVRIQAGQHAMRVHRGPQSVQCCAHRN